MSDDELLRFETALARTLRAPNVAAALNELLSDPAHAHWHEEFGLKHLLASPDGAAGFKIAALLVAKLRFSRLMQGSRIAPQWFEQDPADFAAEFKRYHAEVPPTDFYARGEGERFDAYE